MRRHIRLEWRDLENARAEAVDRADLEPAGDCSATANSSRARLRSAGVTGRRSSGARCASSRHRSCRPCREFAQQAVLHVGRSSFRVGQTQDLRRLHPRQQQPLDAAHHNGRLARAGIGRDPSKELRLGCLCLSGNRRGIRIAGDLRALMFASAIIALPFIDARQMVVVPGMALVARGNARGETAGAGAIGRKCRLQTRQMPLREPASSSPSSATLLACKCSGFSAT